MKRGARKTSMAGFSLIELLVVLAIVGVVLAGVMIGRPKTAAVTAESAARTLSAHLRAARSQAMIRGHETLFWINADTGQYGSDKAVKALPAGLQINLQVSERERKGGIGGFRFYPDGQSSGGDVMLGTKGHQTRLSVNWLTGQPRLEP